MAPTASAAPLKLRDDLVVSELTSGPSKTFVLKQRFCSTEMTGHAKIDCGEQRLIDVAKCRLIHFAKMEAGSWS
jgi:hypothetical protein